MPPKGSSVPPEVREKMSASRTATWNTEKKFRRVLQRELGPTLADELTDEEAARIGRTILDAYREMKGES
jgi:hypothetical protein